MTDSPRWIYDFRPGFSAGDPSRIDVLGGKGASLAAMSRAGFPVPAGFTIAAECCAATRERGEWPEGLRDEVRQAMLRLEAASGRTFGHGPKPLLVAVRSGAAASMPGMMDTILNCGLRPELATVFPSPRQFWLDYAEFVRMFAASVAGLKFDDDPQADPESTALRRIERWRQETGRLFPEDPWEQLDAAIDAVFASWNSERARVYRRRHDVRGVAGTAVNVQSMFPSERAGVLFTANPHDPSRGEMIVEASWGLGESVVSGAVTPDIYVLDAETLALKETIPGARPADEPALDAERLHELARLGQAVDRHFQARSDVEWGWAEGRFALLQARAIRGLEVLAEIPLARREEIARVRELAGPRRCVWVEHNLAETLPYPTPLTWDVVRRFMSGRGGYGRLYRMLGFQPSSSVEETGFLDLIAGRIYVDPRRAARFYFGSLPFCYDVAEILADRRALEAPPRRLDLEASDPLLFARLPGLAWQLWRASRAARRLREASPERFDEFVRTELQRFLDDAAARPLSGFDDAALIAEFERRRDWVLGPLAAESLVPGYFGGLALARLVAWLSQLLGNEAGERLAVELTAGLEGDVTVEQNVALDAVARGDRTLTQFLDEFGHRGANEMELAEPRWSDDPTSLESVVERLRTTRGPRPEELHMRQAVRRRAAEQDLPRQLADAGGSSLLESIRADLAEARELLPYRETGKFHLMRGYATMRSPLLELARRWELGRDLFFLRLEELAEFRVRAGELRQAIRARKLRWQAWQRLPAVGVVDSDRVESLGELPSVAGNTASDGEWPARPLASGVAVGVAVIVRDPAEAADLPEDFILVCPSTDPGWTPLLVGARGLIVERGGVLSHGAIVARDFGIPSVVLEQATRLIPAGARLEIDAGRGRVRVLPGEAAP